MLMVDCSHANSGKQPARQEDVWRSIIEQRVGGTRSLIGAMIESYLHEGSQPIPQNPAELALRRFHHRRLHFVGNDRAHAALGLPDSRRIAARTCRRPIGQRCLSSNDPSRWAISCECTSLKAFSTPRM